MGRKILIAESDKTVQQVVSYFLNLEGFEVATAEDGVAALDAVEAFQPEMILLDHGLAGINGIEVSRLVREKSQFGNVPILFLTDMKKAEEIPPGYGVITKPIDPTKMVSTIKDHIEMAQQSSGDTQPSPAARGGEKDQEGSISIEELLGWEVSEGTGKKEVTSKGEPEEMLGLSAELFRAQETAAQKGAQEDLSDLFLKQEVTEGPLPGETPENVESELKSRITDDMIEDMVSRIARDMIERKVWDVVPRIAEEEIKKEIERLKGESG